MVIGRQQERAVIADALSPRSASPAVLLLGEAGVGKTLLLDTAVEEAEREHARVLRVRGSVAESELAFAGLHQLLLPVLDDGVDGLPARQRAALLGAFGLGEDLTPPDPMMVSLAVLTLASRIASTGRLLLAVDDAQWLDPGSCQVLGFLARRLAGESIALLVAARGTHRPDWLDSTVPQVVVAPLSPAEAEELLGAQPEPPVGPARRQVLATAAGNPLALIELARRAARDGRLPPMGPVPVTDLLESTFAAQADGLPQATREALLIAAAAEGAALSDVLAALPPGSDMEVWLPAEQAGLVHVRADRIEFRHPLVRSAVYGAVPFAERRRAHLALAAALAGDPDRRAWQLSAATVAPDAAVAATLEATAMRTFGRGAVAEALAGLERAAQLHPDTGERTRLLSTAAYTAVLVGDLDRAETLGAQASHLTPDPAATSWISAMNGLVAMLMLRLERAFALVVGEEVPAAGPLAEDVSTIATGIVYHSGIAAQRERIRPMLAARAAEGGEALGRPFHLWDIGVTDPFTHGNTVRALLPAAAAAPGLIPTETHTLGVLGMLLDETETAVSLLGDMVNPQWEDAADFHAGMTAADLAWANFDCGRWADARLGVERLAERFLAGHRNLGSARALTALATVCAVTGEPGTALRHASAALAVTEPARALATVVRARRAAALAATALGDHHAAHLHLSSVFDGSGAPVHYHLSCYAVADHAAAAVLTGHAGQARAALEQVSAAVGAGASARLRQILLRATALLAEQAAAGAHFRAALEDPAGQRWPFERGQVWLEYGEWLRRQRQIADARTALTKAREIFDGLGAGHWAARAEAELRAAGITVGTARHSALRSLTPQRQRIVRLAAQGLTNRQIGERLFLSPRTVGTHLYQVFPALGVTSRSQLRDVVEREAGPGPGL
ncbi:AAA family ATPase [Kitasatospora sp. NPDC101447]|uniref:helix-turn-helix transcriptional regulator n=1 Tax=Kitasatospora sp. NPDC101447 TaxID=3364102 RepID=UPI00381C479B